MDGTAWRDGAIPDAGRAVTALLDEHGARLYRYFWLMLGGQVAATRALTDTVIAALPHGGPELPPAPLFAIARNVCGRYHPVAAVPGARAETATLTEVTMAALRRLDPAEREMCVLSAPRYRLSATDLATVLGTWATDDLRSRASASFETELAAAAADAGFTGDEDLTARALRMFGGDPIGLPYDQIVPLAADPALAALREDARVRAVEPVPPAPPSAPLTVPLPRLSATTGHIGRRRVRTAGTVLLAGAIPVAIASVAWAGHSAHQGHHAPVTALTVISAPPVSATSAAPAPPPRPKRSPKPRPTASAKPTPVPSPTGMPWTVPATPTASPTTSPTPTATPSPTPTATPSATPSATPTSTWTPDPSGS